MRITITGQEVSITMGAELAAKVEQAAKDAGMTVEEFLALTPWKK